MFLPRSITTKVTLFAVAATLTACSSGGQATAPPANTTTTQSSSQSVVPDTVAGRSPEQVSRILGTLKRLGLSGNAKHLPMPGALLFTSPLVRVNVSASESYSFPARWATLTRDAAGVHVSFQGQHLDFPASATVVRNAGTTGAFLSPGQQRPAMLAGEAPDAVF